MGGVDFYDVKKKSFHQIFPKDKTGEDVRALYEDAEYVWIGTSNGIYKVRLHDKGTECKKCGGMSFALQR